MLDKGPLREKCNVKLEAINADLQLAKLAGSRSILPESHLLAI